jgi:HTH-type transcriptional regulator / antitoxin HigA
MTPTGKTKHNLDHGRERRTGADRSRNAPAAKLPTVQAPAGKLYLKLVLSFPLRPLRSDADLDRAVAMVDALTDRMELAPEEADYLEVLGRLIEDYEAEHDPLPAMSPVEALRYLLEENGLTQAELCAQTSLPVATISEVLNGKRGISPRVRQALAKRFKVSPALFV